MFGAHISNLVFFLIQASEYLRNIIFMNNKRKKEKT